MCEKNAICILAVNANLTTFQFAELLKNHNYDIYICIDNNDCILPYYDKTKIQIVRIYNDESEKNYFFGSVVYTQNRACSRDKALYYFCKINNNYEYIWFLEEDVFIPNENTIQRIDETYKNYDLLTQNNEIKLSHHDNRFYWQHWWRNENKIEYPWAHSMICAVRVSKKLLKCILDFVTLNKYLLFDELLFNTIALQNNLIIGTPIELSNVVFSFNDIIPNIVNPTFLYHPIKDLNAQKKIRKKLYT